MKPDRKSIGSKLDPFSAQLLALNDEGKKLLEIQNWLKARGMSASIACISNFLTKLRTNRARATTKDELRSIEYYPEVKKELARRRKFWKGFRNAPRKLRGFKPPEIKMV